jgi:hypothetical protein
MGEQKRRSTIALIGLIALVAALTSFIAAIAQQLIFGKTRVAVTTGGGSGRFDGCRVAKQVNRYAFPV